MEIEMQRAVLIPEEYLMNKNFFFMRTTSTRLHLEPET
jgi:hypothetical protein